MDKKHTQKPTIAIRVLKAPLRAIYKIRDLYISGMYSCASGMGGGSAYATTGLPKSYSTTSSRNEDFAELMRIASTRSVASSRLDGEFLRQQQTAAPPPMLRSQSVAFGRIDEETPSDLVDDLRLKPDMFPRSRSHAVSKTYA